VVARGVDWDSLAIDHSTHHGHLGVMRGEHLEMPHLEGSLPCVTSVDMGPRYHR
jgi:hypothetical protein